MLRVGEQGESSWRRLHGRGEKESHSGWRMQHELGLLLDEPAGAHLQEGVGAVMRDGLQGLSADVPKVEVLEQELAWLKEHLSQLDSPVVFCHNDLLCKNIIYDSAKGHVRFIDYEYAGYNYQAFDIGNHFNEFAGVSEVDYCLYPAQETQQQWLRYYLQAQKGRAVTPREVERLYVQVNKFALASHFFWALWALIQDQFSTIDFDFLRYAVIRFNQYFKVKPQVSALEMPK
uniref:ethanolamine kinase n=1 Tax=Equus caballus TaxID=9796 RepID=A0A9L0TJB7_HORSE